MSVLENIKKIAKNKNLSIYKIERGAGLSNGTIGKWGGEKKQIPNMSSLKKVADYLKVNIGDLID